MKTVTPAQIEAFRTKLSNMAETYNTCAGNISTTLSSTLPDSGISHPKIVENLQILSDSVNAKRDAFLALQEETNTALNNLKSNIDTYIEASTTVLTKNDNTI